VRSGRSGTAGTCYERRHDLHQALVALGCKATSRWQITRPPGRLHGRGQQVVDEFVGTPASFVLQGTVAS